MTIIKNIDTEVWGKASLVSMTQMLIHRVSSFRFLQGTVGGKSGPSPWLASSHFPQVLRGTHWDHAHSNLDLFIIDLLLNVFRTALVALIVGDGTSDGDASSKNFLDSSFEFSGVALWTHLLGNCDDVVHFQVSFVLDILDFLSVSRWLLQGLEDKWGGGWHYLDGSLPVLTADLNVNLDALPIRCCFHDVFANLLWLHTHGRAFGCKRSLRCDFSTDDFHVDEFDFIWVHSWLGWHSILFLPIY